MDVLSALIRDMHMRKQRTQQKRMALQLLTFSGVVRAGHVELRYGAPVATITAFRTQRLAIMPPKAQLTPSRPGANNVTVLKRFWQRVRSLSSIQPLRKPIQPSGLSRHATRYKGTALRLIKGTSRA